MRRRRPIGFVDGRVVALGAVTVACLALTNCTTNSKLSSRVDPRYGVSASPRVIQPGEPVPKGGGTYRVGKPYFVAGRMYVPEENRRYRGEGIASWYGDDFHGRLTANGEVYDMEGVSAAHPTMPMPSYARVTNLRTGHSLIVRVNDRGPYHADRVIDLSSKAADLLEFRRPGTARVKVEYVGPAPLEGSDDRQLMATLREGAPAPTPSSVRVASTRPFEPVDERVRAPAREEPPAARRQEPTYDRPTYERAPAIARTELAPPPSAPRGYEAPAARQNAMPRTEEPGSAARQVAARHPEPRQQAASGKLGELMFSNGRLTGAVEAAPAERTAASAPLPASRAAPPSAAYAEPRQDRGAQVTSGRGLY